MGASEAGGKVFTGCAVVAGVGAAVAVCSLWLTGCKTRQGKTMTMMAYKVQQQVTLTR